MRSLLLFSFLLPLLVLGVDGAASILNADSEKAISDSFIVVLKKGVSEQKLAAHASWADGMLKDKTAKRRFTFSVGDFKGYHLQASKSVAALLAENEEVAYIEADQTVSLPPTTKSRSRSARNVQTNAPWNLARISHRLPGSTEYVYNPVSNVYAYILDTGVKTSHTLFGGQATFGFNAVPGSSNNDGNGHGTHVAGIVSSQTYGVARYAAIIAVKILGDNGSGSTSQVISGINWAVKDMQSKNRVGKAVALMALGGGYSAALNSAVASGSAAGLFFAVPAGSSNTVENGSPATETSACTVGGTTIADARMSSSNYGPAIDIWAPGAQIISLWISSNTAVQTLSGNSMAAAHIAGLGAYFLSLEGPRTPVALCERLRQVATQNALSGIPAGTANLLAYNLSGL